MTGLVIGREGAVATIRLAQPPHNFFTFEMIEGIANALAEFDADSSVRVTLLSAEGKSFCAGADFTKSSGVSAKDVYGQAARIFDRHKPLVAAVGGAAVGGGLGLAMSADFRIANANAGFHANFANIGLHPGFALTATLPAIVGAHRARELLLTARRVDGAEALVLGLVDRLSAPDTLNAEAMAYAQQIAANAPLALKTIGAAVQRVRGDEARAAMAAELAEQTILFATKDFREGVRASVERRPAQFQGA